MNGNTGQERLKSTLMLYRYMTQELAEELLKRDHFGGGVGEYKEVSILFADIHRATALTECLGVEEVVALLNEYFDLMADAIFMYKGTVDKYIDQAIRAVFGSPLPLENHAWRAVQTAIEMRRRLAGFNARRLSIGEEPIRISIGINSDRVFTGNIGSNKRMEFTIVGYGVNLTSSLQRASQRYGCDIVISDATYRYCADWIWARELDRVRLEGTKRPVTIYEVVGLRSEPISEQRRQAIEHYHKGREYYLQRRFRDAWNEFATIVEDFDSDDKAADLYMRRCQYCVNKVAPPNDWDGVWTFTEE